MSPVITPNTTEMLDFTPIEPGTYPGTIPSHIFGPSKQGNPMLTLTCLVQVDDGEPRQRKAWVVTEGAGSGQFDQLLRAVGMGELADIYADKSNDDKPPFDSDALNGQSLMFVITENMYEGQKRDAITGFLPA